MSNAAKKISSFKEGNFDVKIQDSQRLFDELQKDSLGFTLLSTYLKNVAGIFLPQNSKNLCLMASRLNTIMKNLNLTKYKDYHKLLQNGDKGLNQEFISALTTNTTQFFREDSHFSLLEKLIPALLEKKRKDFSDEIRVWCAASSTGQEPYSIAMTLMEKIPDHHKWTVSMLATDIDDEVLSRAKNGIYSGNELNSLKENFRKKYFKNTKTNEYQVANALRSMITFSNFNLLTGNYSFSKKFDIIFCRNVLIYFDAETQKQVVEKLITCLHPDAYLFLGHSESGAVKSNLTNVIAHAAYQRKR